MSQKVGYSYIRFSTKEQAEGDSLRRQIEARDAWCKKNEVVLDTSVTYHDFAVSAFTGKHRDNPDKFALATFVDAVQQDKIAPDSYLIVENLDRLTREDLRPATIFFLSLLDAGINIVTTTPEKLYRHDSKDMIDIILAVIELARGHGESARKSQIVGEAWREKKQDAIDQKKALTAMCPHWLRVEGEQYVQIPDRVQLIQRMFREATEGVGVGALARKLNLEGIKPFRIKRNKRDEDKPHIWGKSSVARILSNRAVLGEYQRHKGHRDRTPEGDPVPDFYPRIISEGQFATVQLAMKSRRHVGVVERSVGVNLFSGLVKAEDRTPYIYHNKGKIQESSLARSDTLHGTKPYQAMYYRVFEQIVLQTLREIDPAELVSSGGKKAEAERLAEAQGKVLAAEDKIRTFEERLYEDHTNTTWVKLLDRAKVEKEAAVAEVRDARRTLSMPIVEGLGESHNLIDLLKKTPTQELRQKLRAKIAQVISEITISLYAPRKRYVKMGWLQLKFRNTGYVRNILFIHMTARRSRNFSKPEVIHVELVHETPTDQAFFSDRLIEAMADIEALEQAKKKGPEALRAESERVKAKYNL